MADLAKSMTRCICGGRLGEFEHIPERGIRRAFCRSCGTEYGYPEDHPFFKNQIKKEIIHAPGFTPANKPIKDPPKLYRCKRCGAPIEKGQALRTFGIHGKALCADCEEDV